MKRLLLGSLVLLTSLGLAHAQDVNSSSPSYVRVDSIALRDRLETMPALASGPESDPGGGVRVPADREGETKSRFWISSEYLLWKIKRSNLPPLVAVTTNINSPGSIPAIGRPGTVVVLGGSKLERGEFPGGRFTAGMWVNKERNIGVEVGYFFLRERTFNFQLSSSGEPGSLTIGIPSFDPIFGSEEALRLSFSGNQDRASGSVSVTSPTRLLGAETNLIYRLRRNRYGLASLLGGFRYLDLKEQLTMVDINSTQSTNSVNIRTAHIFRTDQFSTRNQIYGAKAEARFDFSYHRLNLKMDVSAALGVNRQSVQINGSTSDDVDHQTFTGGFFALVTNIGQYRRDRLIVAPEAMANLGYNFNSHFRASVGYDFFYLNKIVRPEEQIDRVVNFTRVPAPDFQGSSLPLNFGPLRPVFNFKESDFWAQGLSIGIQTRF